MDEPEILGPCDVCGCLIDASQGRVTDGMFSLTFCYRCVTPEDEAAARFAADVERSLEEPDGE